MTNAASGVDSLIFREYTLNNYSTYKAIANKKLSSKNSLVVVMKATAYKVAALVVLVFTFSSNVVFSIANLAIRAANFTYVRIFSKESPKAKLLAPATTKGNDDQTPLIVGIGPREVALVAVTEKNADQMAPIIETVPKEQAPIAIKAEKNAGQMAPIIETRSNEQPLLAISPAKPVVIGNLNLINWLMLGSMTSWIMLKAGASPIFSFPFGFGVTLLAKELVGSVVK